MLVSGVKAENILHMNMESLQHRELLGYLAFYDYVSNHIVKGNPIVPLGYAPLTASS